MVVVVVFIKSFVDMGMVVVEAEVDFYEVLVMLYKGFCGCDDVADYFLGFIVGCFGLR